MDPITIMAIAGAVANLISTLKGSLDAAKQNKRTEDMYKQQMARAEEERRAAGKNYLDTLEGKTYATRVGKQLQDNASAVSNNAIKTGATNEQRLAQMSNVQDAYNNLIQRLAAQSTNYNAYQDALLSQARGHYIKNQAALNTAKAQSDVNSGNGMANAVGNLATAGIQMNGFEGDATPTKKSAATGPVTVTTPTRQKTTVTRPWQVPTSFDFEKITQKDVERANDMFLGNDYLRRYIQYK